MAAALDAGRRGRDLVVVDLPRHFDDASLLALTAAERCYLVVAAEPRACAAAARVAAVAVRHCPALSVVVRASARPSIRPPEVAAALNLPLVGLLPDDRDLPRSMAAGRPPGGRWAGPAGGPVPPAAGRHDAAAPGGGAMSLDLDLVRRVRDRLADSGAAPTPGALITAVRAEPGPAALGDATLLRLGDRLHDELAGAGPLTELLADPAVTDILVNGPGGVWVDRGAGLV
jgi:hypothetical protein